jgi:hypothetical protein
MSAAHHGKLQMIWAATCFPCGLAQDRPAACVHHAPGATTGLLHRCTAASLQQDAAPPHGSGCQSLPPLPRAAHAAPAPPCTPGHAVARTCSRVVEQRDHAVHVKQAGLQHRRHPPHASQVSLALPEHAARRLPIGNQLKQLQHLRRAAVLGGIRASASGIRHQGFSIRQPANKEGSMAACQPAAGPA